MKRGRPPTGQRTPIQVKLSTAERAEVDAAAAVQCLATSTWMRQVVLKEARKVNKAVLSVFLLAVSASPVHANGACGLHGRVRFVEAFGKYRVRVSSSFADLKVKQVGYFPEKAGEWQAVSSGEDFTVQVVSSGEDFTIRYVDAFPGCN